MKTPITVRIEAELLAEARRCAQEENRTLTNFIETVLRQRIDGAGSSSADPVGVTVVQAARRSKEKATHAA